MRTLTVGPAKLEEWANNRQLSWMASLQPLRKHLQAKAVRRPAKTCCGGRRRQVTVVTKNDGVPPEVWNQVLSDRRFQTDMRTLRQQLRLDRLTVKVGQAVVCF